jgi:hypothetical protein
MIRRRGISEIKFRYHPNDMMSICALCGNDFGSVYFRGKRICEECLGMVKDMY